MQIRLRNDKISNTETHAGQAFCCDGFGRSELPRTTKSVYGILAKDMLARTDPKPPSPTSLQIPATPALPTRTHDDKAETRRFHAVSPHP